MHSHTNRSVLAVVGVATVLLVFGSVRAAEVTVDGRRYSDPQWETVFSVDLSGVAGVTGVTATAANGTSKPIASFAPDQYGGVFGPFGSFAGFEGATVGGWQITVHFAGGEAVYDMAVNSYRSSFADADFPPAPTVLSPVDGEVGVSPTPTFQWDNGGTHSGPLESLFVSVISEVDPTVADSAGSTGPGLGLNDETWTPSVALPAGDATFTVLYETNEEEEANVDDPVFNASASTIADPGLTWDRSGGDLFSLDEVTFTVPEPTTLSVLAIAGVLAATAGRKRRR